MTKKRQEAVQTERTLVEQTAIEQPKANVKYKDTIFRMLSRNRTSAFPVQCSDGEGLPGSGRAECCDVRECCIYGHEE